MKEPVVIVGAGGQGKVVAELAQACHDPVLGFLDDGVPTTAQVAGLPILGKVADFRRYLDCRFVLAVGDGPTRRRWAQQLSGVRWYTGMHPSAVLSPRAVLGEGTVVLPQAVVHTDAVVGRHCIINSGAIVEHDCRIGDFVHLSVGARLGGGVMIGDDCFLGMGAVVRDHRRIAARSVIGMGTVVVEDLVENGVYVGIPARKRSAE